MDKIIRLISCHKNTKTLKSRTLHPIQVGGNNIAERFEGRLADNIGENISSKNENYRELTAQYCAWENLDADYYVFSFS